MATLSAMPTEQASPKVRFWLEELDLALKREKDWRKSASQLVELYESGKAKASPFNILYSNTDTLAPALYNNLPRPVAQRRFKDEKPIAKVASTVIQRTLEFLLDSNDGDHPSFDDLMEQAVLEALVPGRGLVWFKYEAEFEEGEGNEVEDGEPGAPAPTRVTYESVCGEYVPWDRFRHGYGKKWKDVPWVAREHLMSKSELEESFGKEAAKRIPLTVSSKVSEEAADNDRREMSRAEEGSVDLAQVFEIWDKSERKVLFIAPAAPGSPVKEVPDPLELEGFFPCPEPLRLYRKISSLLPTPLYDAYREQAEELNTVTIRINKIIRALKVRGLYDATVEGLSQLLSSDDNTLLPAENVAALQQGQSLEKAIWFFPAEKLVPILQQLYIQREQIKQVIYEITGISDILRGSSVASETATAQNIKNQWGTLRLKRMQKRTATFVRDCMRVMAEIACTKMSAQTIGQMTGISLPTAEQQAQAKQLFAQIQQMGQQGGQLPPEAQQHMGQLQSILSSPALEDVEGLLRSDLQRNFQIDLETNSTVDVEATEDKQNVGEFLNALAQYFNGVAPMIQAGTLPFDAAKAILLAVTRRYRFGTEVEDQIEKMAPPPAPQGMPPEVQKAQEEVQKAQEQLQKERMALDQSKKEFELEKAFTLKEIDFSKQMAIKEVQAVHKEKATELTFQVKDADRGLALREEDLQRKAKEAETAASAEKTSSETVATAAQTAATEALQSLREEFTQNVVTALREIMQSPRRARKLPDGSWETF